MNGPAPDPSTRGGEPRVCYLHGRPGPHPLHGRFARALGADFHPVDHPMRWQDRDRSTAYRMLASVVAAWSVPRRKRYDVFLVDNLHFSPVIMKGLLLRRRRQKIVAHLGSHTLYFLRSHRFSPLVERLHLWALARYDALLCEGSMARELVEELLPGSAPPTYVTFLGPPRERNRSLRAVRPDLDGKRLLLIAGGATAFRLHYKGLDLMLDAFGRAYARDPELRFDILGGWPQELRERALSALGEAGARDAVRFLGHQEAVEPFLEASALYLHCARGDAFPTATLEAMSAGVVPMVSEWTGTREVVEPVEPRLVRGLDAEDVARGILWYTELPASERRRLSEACRAAADGYTEERAVAHYRETFHRLCRDLGVPDRG